MNNSPIVNTNWNIHLFYFDREIVPGASIKIRFFSHGGKYAVLQLRYEYRLFFSHR
jgi:hypothetical protein